jgi:hypothetical protein
MPLFWLSLLYFSLYMYHYEAHQNLILRDNAGAGVLHTRDSFLSGLARILPFARAHNVLPQTLSRGEALCHQRSTSCRFCMS